MKWNYYQIEYNFTDAEGIVHRIHYRLLHAKSLRTAKFEVKENMKARGSIPAQVTSLIARSSDGKNFDPFLNSKWRDGKEFEERVHQFSTGKVVIRAPTEGVLKWITPQRRIEP